MGNPYTRAPHMGGHVTGGPESPHAALLIDFDNVTMGMRSDLSRELKTLLDSDIIKGKVSVQRAYADWRRYPQYIVPLSEASVDLIFAPAYGSNKKNATDIRMAIDGLELVFTRPEIGTFILLTGDSDFSSLVLKLKEYGKYVIGVGIQESTSDILVQNCDEYYSYTTLTGLRKTTESDQRSQDPWVLVKEALKKMASRDDVMRSDRLKQVMQEIDPAFDEGSLGFSKFSRFLTEASSRGLVKLKKLENGQYEVAAGSGRGRRDDGEGREGRRGRGRGRRDRESRAAKQTPEPFEDRDDKGAEADAGADPLRDGYGLLVQALEQLREAGRDPVRDSDVKRKMLEIDRSFDEAELGFPKFSKFLAQASDHEVVRLLRTENGNVEVALVDGRAEPSSKPESPEEVAEASESPAGVSEPEPRAAADEAPPAEAPKSRVLEIRPSEQPGEWVLGPRRGSTRRRGADEGPQLFEGQAVAAPSGGRSDEPSGAGVAASSGGDFDAGALGLPTEEESIQRYLTHRYRGVGEKTAESLVQRFGRDLFRVLRDDPDAIRETVTGNRADQVLEAWNADYERRTARGSGGSGGSEDSAGENGGGRRGGRRRGSRGRGAS